MIVPLQRKRWRVAEPISPDQRALLGDHPPLLAQLLYNRGIRDCAQADEFLAGEFPAGQPFKLKGMMAAVARIRRAILNGELVAVYGDFDTDGVTATALLVEALTAAGACAMPYIPHRVDEGYGLNLEALRHLYRQGARLVITVDCGIRSIEEVATAGRGLDLIVTDHHSPDEALPTATAVINPNQDGCAYPFKKLAGVGVAFKLAQAVYHDCRHDQRRARPGGADVDDEALLDLVALGTVADVVPLVEENRALVLRGLKRINDPAAELRPGIEALMANASVRRGEVDAEAVAFRLGPRINAAGRIDRAMLAYELLTGSDPVETAELAARLGALNRERQELTDEMVAEAERQVESDADAHLYLVGDADFNPGIVGLAASRLVENYYRPAIVVEVGEKYSRGSCRSIPEFHITKALDQCRDLLVRHGGHEAAAGFTVRTQDLDVLRRRLQEIAAAKLAGVERRAALDVDAEVLLEEVGWDTLDMVRAVEPCGAENARPVLTSRGVIVMRRKVTSGGKHLSLVLRDGNGVAWDAIHFRQGAIADHVPGRIDVAYTLGVREWNGNRRLQLTVEDLRPAT
ncbi:MAG TPA: single-stranded-DNA-specific exonuclease RecJ [Anaerolineae bacterium]|nr:single-stranded-DNA-specific exonuclease RecJ [Anaerolineae bacterium]